MGVLEGIKVLDLGRYIAGPFCAALLGDYGADVIRVDRVGGSEDRYILPVSEQGDGAQFLQVNRNKRSISLEIATPQGKEVLHELIRRSDVVIANMPPRTLAKLGLDYESLRAVRPDIVLTASTAFGSAPAVRDRVGFDGVGQCISGAVHITGLPDHPMKFMVPAVDFATGLSCALGTMMALYERKSSGTGQEVGASLLQTSLNFASSCLIEEAVLHVDRKATLNRAPHYAPSDIFRTRDGWFIAQVIGPAMFKRWTRLIGKPELFDDERFQSDPQRGEHGEYLSGLMNEWSGQFTRAEALALLTEARIPASPVNSPREALEDDAIRAAEAFHPVEYPGVSEPVPLIKSPVALSRTPPSIRLRPPQPGEHTDEVLGDIGYSKDEIARLRAQGIV
ncbi:L-carnitine dehydratase/bile acid-inducible protein F [Caballeronia hypogeia]|uniref:L-carnitine dehydratase/bile acid-inducible protein F n=1 Tax=Caballeronia hypogeia TaxID=1777140 RepID=A0A158DNE1_9BURK|nr:CoA transferase [Caballeronia hypogeia]SAK96129.1 L-carnitine dehydratase/bile acid-inducible protein F [Caballeronia hypogeia]